MMSILRWWQIMVCFLIGIIAYHMPEINESMIKYIKRMEVEDESQDIIVSF